jgi:hypothetical protein
VGLGGSGGRRRRGGGSRTGGGPRGTRGDRLATGSLRPLAVYHPSNGLNDQTFHLFITDSAQYVGVPVDLSESERIEWVALADVRRIVRDGSVRDGLSLTALSLALLFELPAV